MDLMQKFFANQSCFVYPDIYMLTAIHPKLPMRDITTTQAFYVQHLGFKFIGAAGDGSYLMLEKDQIQLHFFAFKDLNPYENYGQVYIRTDNIDHWYQHALKEGLQLPTLGHLQTKPWGQREFSLLDPDHNLLTFGQEA